MAYDHPPAVEEFDVVIAGSGAGGLATAISAAEFGLSAVVLEKAPQFGGTTARSGGWIWIPNNSQGKAQGIEDSYEKARQYIEAEVGNFYDAAKVEAFLTQGPQMLDFFETKTEAKFTLGAYFSDYHPYQPGGLTGGRSLNADPVNRAILGKDGNRVAEPLKEATFLGMMVGSNRELKHFFEATRSIKSFGYVGVLLARYAWEKLRYGKPMRLTNGAALVARLAKSTFDRGVEIRTENAVVELIEDGGRVIGVVVDTPQGRRQIFARKGVVLATGGFPNSAEFRKSLYPHSRDGEGHWSPAGPLNTGDAMTMTRKLAAGLVTQYPQPAAWVPVSLVPRGDGTVGPFPHFVDRGKPGIIAVLANGRRFTNEANSYHDFISGLLPHKTEDRPAECWLITDHAALRRYGLGHVKPAPIPLQPALKSGYLKRGKTLAELAKACGINPAGLEKTVADFNLHARRDGSDPEFGRGTTGYNLYLGDPEHTGPNPCVKPIEEGPYYAIRVVAGDLGSFAGHQTDASARVLAEDGRPIAGLFAVGNDAASMMGGNYPGGGITLGPAMTFGYIAAKTLAEPQS